MPTVERILPCRGGKSVSVLLSDGKKVRISRARLASLRLEPGQEAPPALLKLLEASLTPEKAQEELDRIRQEHGTPVDALRLFGGVGG